MEVGNRHPRTQDAPTRGVRTPAAAGTNSRPTKWKPPRMAQPWGQESLDYAQSEGDAQRSSPAAERAAALDLDLWLHQTSDMGQLTLQVWTWWLLMDIHHILNGHHL